MSQHQGFSDFMRLIELRQQIRFGTAPEKEDLFQTWFKYEEAIFNRCCNCVRRKVFQRELDLLVEAIADELVPTAWREECLIKARRPINGMARIASKPAHWQAVHRARDELTALENYSLAYVE